MKNLKVVILSALVMTGLAGCGEKEVHQHTFAEEWSSNETQHWHAATCEHTEEKASLSNHIDENHDGKCDVCSREGLEVKHVDTGNGTCSCGLKISVVDVELDISEAKLVYSLGEELETEGVKLTATYLDGSEAEIEFEASADLSSVGEKVVTLEYDTEDEAHTKKTISYNVNVVYWSEEDLGVLGEVTMLGWYNLALPFMEGLKVDYTLDEDGYIQSWNLLKEDATLDDLQEYYELLTNYSKTVAISGKQVTFDFTEKAKFGVDELAFIEEEYGFASGDFFVVSLAPWYMSGGYPGRCFIADEYFVVGVTAQGELKAFDKFVTSYFEGYFGGVGSINGQGFDVKELVHPSDPEDEPMDPNYFIEAVSDIPYYYGSEFAELYIGMPEFDNDDGFVFFTSYKGLLPFDPYYDDLDLSVEVDYINGSETAYLGFIDNLLKLGYTKDEEADIYTLENEYLGKVSYEFVPYSETFTDSMYGEGVAEQYYRGLNAGFAVIVEYSAPDRDDYVTYFTPELDSLLKGFGEKAEYIEINTDYYDSYGELIADFYVVSEGEPLDSEVVLGELVDLLPERYFPVDEASYDSKYGCYEQEFTDGTYGIYLSVYDADKDGDCEVTLEIFEGEETMETFVYNKIVAYAENAGVPLQLQVIPQEESYIVGTMLPVAAAEGLGIENLTDVAEYIAGNYINDSGFLVASGNPSGDFVTNITVPAQSVDGEFDVTFQFSVQTISEVDYYVVSILIESSAPWAGTAAEGFAFVANGLGLQESLCHFDEASGTYYTSLFIFSDAYPYSQEILNALLNSAFSTAISYLPKGAAPVGNPTYNSTTGLYDLTCKSADGSVTFVIHAGVSSNDEGASIFAVLSIEVCATPAE